MTLGEYEAKMCKTRSCTPSRSSMGGPGQINADRRVAPRQRFCMFVLESWTDSKALWLIGGAGSAQRLWGRLEDRGLSDDVPSVAYHTPASAGRADTPISTRPPSRHVLQRRLADVRPACASAVPQVPVIRFTAASFDFYLPHSPRPIPPLSRLPLPLPPAM